MNKKIKNLRLSLARLSSIWPVRNVRLFPMSSILSLIELVDFWCIGDTRPYDMIGLLGILCFTNTFMTCLRLTLSNAFSISMKQKMAGLLNSNDFSQSCLVANIASTQDLPFLNPCCSS